MTGLGPLSRQLTAGVPRRIANKASAGWSRRGGTCLRGYPPTRCHNYRNVINSQLPQKALAPPFSKRVAQGGGFWQMLGAW